ncbi:MULTISPECIES: extracellular catalytic domain type 1 short-chain-length polyhydroxyalkanoate depolymerase [Xenophilus]|uniref:extracellular catalytic domain type 1 short-chain-length polyhydroxyalkanoate depolymerase n=1 Tax=Xenophilus TaxID=151754 RepID=UPI00056E8D42|nr:PHB depolymerase family esterase [Xenophilus azovorans]
MARRPFVPALFRCANPRQVRALARAAIQGGRRMAGQLQSVMRQRPPPGPGEWIAGMAAGPGGVRGFHVYRPPDMAPDERLPLLVMLHGCGQTARDFAIGTRMNRLAARERFLVLYPEQDLLANPQGCWNWFELRSGQALAEAATLLSAIDRVCMAHGGDRARVAVAGLSAGAGMAALLGLSAPERFVAVAMHSGVAPGAARSRHSALAAMAGRRAPALGASPAVPLPPLLVLQGDADAVVAPVNGERAARAWAEAGGARPAAAQQRQRGQRLPMRVTAYRRRGRTQVVQVDIHGLGHDWSGGATASPFTDPRGPDASALVWGFVARQLRRLQADAAASGQSTL